jgi:hypothetical protein
LAFLSHIEAAGVQCLSAEENLRSAVKVELAEIDKYYPVFIERNFFGEAFALQSKPGFAWEAEKQRRELL